MNNLMVSFLVVLFLVVASQPDVVSAGTTVEQVQKNVENLWKGIKEKQPHVMAKELKKIVDKGGDFVLLDIRTESEYTAAHLPGAVHISRGVLEWKLPKKITDTNTTIYVYCRTGARGALATQRLLDIGYANAINVHDAFKGWAEAGYPVYNRHGEFVMAQGGFEKKE